MEETNPVVQSENGTAVPEIIVDKTPVEVPAVVENTGEKVCPLCGSKFNSLGRKNKTIACESCLQNIVKPIISAKNPRRNDKCSCQSGVKFKNCCGKNL